jgi:hypothetical protein
MRYSCIQSFVQKYRQSEYNWRMQNSHDGIFEDIKDLIPPDILDIKGKLDCCKITEMSFFEINTIMENEFIKSFYRVMYD